MKKLKIFFEDDDIIVAEKPVGVESQESRGFAQDMVSLIRNHRLSSTQLSTSASTRPEPTYVGVIHRLDRQVSGVMVYAKTRKAAAVLSSAVQKGEVHKTYHAVVCGKPVDKDGQWVDYLLKNGKTNTSAVVDKSVEDAKKAVLNYRVLGTIPDSDAADGSDGDGNVLSLLEIDLLTGRHHQIRVQCASRNLSLWGDVKYNPRFSNKRGVNPALCSVKLSFVHPITGKPMTFSMKPEAEIFRRFRETGVIQ